MSCKYFTMNDFFKRLLELKHKYYKRTGSSGNYKYFYTREDYKKYLIDTAKDETKKRLLILSERLYQEVKPADKDKIKSSVTAWKTKTDTFHLHKLGRTFTKERKKLHDSIKNTYYDYFNHAKTDKPKVVFMAGLPASGKTTSVKNIFTVQENTKGIIMKDKDNVKYLVLNADDIKSYIPEFENGLGASRTHEESSHLLDKIVKKAIKQKVNVIIDGTFKSPKKAIKTKSRFENDGYESSLIYIDVKPEESLKRAKSRYEHSGRFVPYEFIAEIGDNIKYSIDDIKKTFDKFTHIDNNTTPKIVEER